MKMNKTARHLIRATFIALGIYWICRFYGGVWRTTSDAIVTGKLWIFRHGWLLTGIAFAVAGLFWKKAWDWVVWQWSMAGIPERIMGKILLVGGGFAISIGTLTLDVFSPVLCLLLIWLGVLFTLMSGEEQAEEPVDDYHRQHLVSRLAELLSGTPENVRRIGILAEWGEGKTRLMKLLEDHLSRHGKDQFRMAWVNPWRADSGEKAWVEIARGVDQALGFPRLLPQSLLALPVVGTLLELLPKSISGFTADLKTLLTSDGSASERIASGLEEFLKARKQWLLIFVDDMERVGHEELKKIFPVIDRLSDLKRCYFVFALDPKRVAKAFGETDAHDEQTKGYLDKILDLQLTLPEASKQEVFELLDKKIDKKACPKLGAVLPALKEYLPVNPRQVDRFLRDADARERMFLSRFGPEEEDYEGFFLLLILEIRYPRIFREAWQNPDFMKNAASAVYSSVPAGQETSGIKLIKDYATSLCPGDARDYWILLRHLHILCRTRNTLDLRWGLEGYRKLIELSYEERQRFIKRWREQSGNEPLEHLLEGFRKFHAPELVIREALEFELHAIRDLFSEAANRHREELPLDEIEEQIRERVAHFTRHAQAIRKGRLLALDREVFGRELFDVWIKVANQSIPTGMPPAFSTAMNLTRKHLTQDLLVTLKPQDQFELTWLGSTNFVSTYVRDTHPDFNKEISPVIHSVRDDFHGRFARLMSDSSAEDFYPPSWMPDAENEDLRDPYCWLSVYNKSSPTLERLVVEAMSNKILQDNFAWLIRSALLSAYRIPPELGVRSLHRTRSGIRENPWYLRLCWQGAWAGLQPPEGGLDLIKLLNKALSIESSENPEVSVFFILDSLPMPGNILEQR